MGPLSKRGSDLAAIRAVIWAVLCGALVECGLCLLWTVGCLGAGLMRVDLWKDSESLLYRTLNFISVLFVTHDMKWYESVNLILTIKHDLWTD